ncbi:MAG: LLM class flavin-dependent oxidoreductase, partial [Pseudomonadota bacterium]
RKLWQGDYAHEGDFYQFPSTSSAPKPVQEDGPPLWIAARDPASHDFAVSNRCNVQVTPLWQGVEEVRSLMSRFNDACEKQNPSTRPKIMLLHHCYVSENDSDLDRAVGDLHKFYCYFGAWFKNQRPVNQGLIQTLSDEEVHGNKMVTQDGIRNDLTVGSTTQVIDRIKLYQDLGYDEFSYWIDSGMSHEHKRASLCRFIDHVMPHFV